MPNRGKVTLYTPKVIVRIVLLYRSVNSLIRRNFIMKLILTSVVLAAIGLAQSPPPCPPLCPPPERGGGRQAKKKVVKEQKPQAGTQTKNVK